VIKFVNLIPAAVLFFRFFVPFLRWATNALSDGEVTYQEVVAATREFWPKKDADGDPLPIPFAPFKTKKG
jgi:hypothetical protein